MCVYIIEGPYIYRVPQNSKTSWDQYVSQFVTIQKKIVIIMCMAIGII